VRASNHRLDLSFVELHFHLLPGVDDGPTCVEESAALAAAAVADGTRTVVVTPHVHPAHITHPTEIHELTSELADHLRRERIPLSLEPGGELDVRMVARLAQHELESIAHGPRGSRWVLLEAPFEGLDDRFTQAADELRHRGFTALIAHPERSSPTPDAAEILARELALGSAVQLTASAFTSGSGRTVHDEALRLLRSAPIAVIASDAHGPNRPPELRDAVAALARTGERDPARFAGSIPRALLTHGLPARDVSIAA
jgi:protein-tyrosine phosphatase